MHLSYPIVVPVWVTKIFTNSGYGWQFFYYHYSRSRQEYSGEAHRPVRWSQGNASVGVLSSWDFAATRVGYIAERIRRFGTAWPDFVLRGRSSRCCCVRSASCFKHGRERLRDECSVFKCGMLSSMPAVQVTRKRRDLLHKAAHVLPGVVREDGGG